MSMDILLGKLEKNFTSQNTPRVMSIWYDHMTYLKTRPTLDTIKVSDHQCIKFEGDFWGLLQDMGVPSQYHPFVAAFNGYSHPSDYRGTQDMVKIPDLQAMEVILKVNMTRTN